MAHQSADAPAPDDRDPSARHLRAFVRARSRGDRSAMSEAWKQLLLAEWPRMMVMIAGAKHDALPNGRIPPEDRDDVAHRAFLRLHDWLKLEGSSIGEVRAIIRRAVRWSVLDHMREHVDDDAHQVGSLDDLDDATGEPAAFVRHVEDEVAARLVDRAEAHDLRSAVRGALADLQERTRTVVVLRLVGYSAKEVAEELGVTPANVDQIYHRGLKQLRKALEDFR